MHIINKLFITDELKLLRVHSNFNSIQASDVELFLNELAINVDSSLHDKIGDFLLSNEQLHAFTRLNWENIKEIQDMLISMRCSESRSLTQALVVFLFKL